MKRLLRADGRKLAQITITSWLIQRLRDDRAIAARGLGGRAPGKCRCLLAAPGSGVAQKPQKRDVFPTRAAAGRPAGIIFSALTREPAGRIKASFL
ncbi:MAG: hypothetical protein LPJ95_01255, partial [Paracoccaceae bacterium]|nr:hypothetical protein [Paracoccaceae bacterium]